MSKRSPRTPHQFVFSARTVVGWAMIAVVHSTVWIFAISALRTSRERSKRSSSESSGWRAWRWSAIALCSRMKRLWRMLRPTQKAPGTTE